MQREILFRGKRVDNGEWVEGCLVYSFEGVHIADQYFKPSNGQRPELYDVDPDTVGQFTGLMDKNGNRIFEGDVVDRGSTYLIEWYSHRWLARKIYDDWFKRNVFAQKDYLGISSFSDLRIEIIGNIHDNPELLQ